MDDVTEQIAKAPDGKPDAALEKQLKDAQEKLASTTMAETSALAAFAAVESNIKDAEADVKRITGTKAKNAATSRRQRAPMRRRKRCRTKPRPISPRETNRGQARREAAGRDLFRRWAKGRRLLRRRGAQGVGRRSGTPIEQAEGTAAAKTTLTASPDGTFTAARWSSCPRAALRIGCWSERSSGDALGGSRERGALQPGWQDAGGGGGEPSRSGDISLWDVAGGKLVKTWKERHADAVLSLDFSPDGKLLASGGADKMARVTEIASGKQVNLFEGHTHHVHGGGIPRRWPRARHARAADGVVLVWDMILGERKKKIEGWNKEVTSLQFIGATTRSSPRPATISSASSTITAQVRAMRQTARFHAGRGEPADAPA